MAVKKKAMKPKRITAKQKSARRRNIKVAQSVRKKGTSAQSTKNKQLQDRIARGHAKMKAQALRRAARFSR